MLTLPYPKNCEACSDCDKKRLGCGISSGIPWTSYAEGDGYQGQAQQVYERNDPKKRGRLSLANQWERTCPQYFARSPFVLSVLQDLEDYKNNRMGDVRDLPAPHWVYLRIAENETKLCHDWWEAELMPDPPGKDGR